MGHLVQPPAEAGSPTAVCTGPCPGGSGISPEQETPQPPWAACSSALSPSEGRSSSSKREAAGDIRITAGCGGSSGADRMSEDCADVGTEFRQRRWEENGAVFGAEECSCVMWEWA